MKIARYILIGLALISTFFFTWFFLFFYKVPDLDIPENASEQEKIVLIDSWFEELNAQNKFNGAVLIAKKGKPLLIKGHGFTNYHKNEKITKKSSFRLASLSKQFTAAGIMLLKERGLIEYDHLVSKYIDNFPYQEVTIRSLLNHTSGVPDRYLDLAEDYKKAVDILSNKKAVNLLIMNHPKAEFVPFEKYEYSNTNYILLARIVEVVSERTFEDYMKIELFNPLGMQNTRVWNLLSKEKTFKNKTGGFHTFFGYATEMRPTFVDGVAGDGAVFSSVNDFLIWDQFWYENELLTQDNLKEAFEIPSLKSDNVSTYGFGWGIHDNTTRHYGMWLAANTFIIRNTDKKTCIVLLDNSFNIFFRKIVEQLQ